MEADDVPLQNSAVGENPPRIFLDDSDDEVGVVYASSCSLDVDPRYVTCSVAVVNVVLHCMCVTLFQPLIICTSTRIQSLIF